MLYSEDYIFLFFIIFLYLYLICLCVCVCVCARACVCVCVCVHIFLVFCFSNSKVVNTIYVCIWLDRGFIHFFLLLTVLFPSSMSFYLWYFDHVSNNPLLIVLDLFDWWQLVTSFHYNPNPNMILFIIWKKFMRMLASFLIIMCMNNIHFESFSFIDFLVNIYIYIYIYIEREREIDWLIHCTDFPP